MKLTVGHVLVRCTIGDMISNDFPNLATGTVTEDDLRPSGIIERETAKGKAALIDQCETLCSDFLRSL